jgi:hypothetical protein
MKKLTSTLLRTLTPAALMSLCLPLHAAPPAEVHWTDVCHYADHRPLVVTTSTGEVVEGYCVSTTVDGISVMGKDHRVVKIARTAFSRMQMQLTKNPHRLKALGSGMHSAMKEGFDMMFSPLAPVGLVVIPGTLAWGIAAAPFCILGDLRNKIAGNQEIRVI